MRLVLALLVLLGLGAPSVAWPHAALLETEPADGAQVERLAEPVRLRFDESVGIISLRLVGAGGREIAPLSPPSVLGTVLHAAYPPDLPAGGYVLSYRITSADSHPVAGAVRFGLGAAAPAGEADTGANPWTAPSEFTRFLFYLATAVTAGACLFRALVAELGIRVRRALSMVGIAGAFLAALQVGLRGALLAASPAGALFDRTVWQLAAETTLAASLALTGSGLLLCAAGLRARWRIGSLLGVPGALAAAAGFALSGHAATAEPRWLTAPAVGLHALSVSFWVGGLLALWLMMADAAAAGRAARRFSLFAVPAVGVLVACGLILATVQLGRPAALVDTAYGLLVCGKLVLLAGLVGLAAWNRNRLTPALLAGKPYASSAMRASIAGEAMLVVAVLGLTSVLSLTPPPRGEAHGAAPVLVMAMQGGVMAHFEVAPARPGQNRIGVTLFPETIAPKEAWLELWQPAAGIGPLRRKLVADGAGGWELDSRDLILPGKWTLRLELLLTDFDELTLTAELPLR